MFCTRTAVFQFQHEMALVNKADSDRDTIDAYMEELDSLHREQLSMIQSLEEVSHPSSVQQVKLFAVAHIPFPPTF